MESEIQTYSETNPAPVAAPPKLGFWSNLMATLWIINGALSSITIIGAPIGIPSIIAGAKLLKVASLSKELTVTDPKTAELLDNLNSFLKINGLMFIISMGCIILFFLAVIFFGLMGLLFGLDDLIPHG